MERVTAKWYLIPMKIKIGKNLRGEGGGNLEC
jgi:hypothetical protein